MPEEANYEKKQLIKRIAIIGGGPSGMFMLKRLLESDCKNIKIEIFEKSNNLGSGMPYSNFGATDDHITNVSENEIPALVTPIHEWIQTVDKETLDRFEVDSTNLNTYKVLPRLLFGQYLTAQFSLLLKQAKQLKIEVHVNYESLVTDLIDIQEKNQVCLEIAHSTKHVFDVAIICTGHYWPKKHELTTKGYFDSPYPPAKLNKIFNHPIAINGSSLTAVDAIKTVARKNGVFTNKNGKLHFTLTNPDSNFRIVLHSRSGMLPAVRFHLEDPHLSHESLLSKEELANHIKNNDGFLSLDFIFEKKFKDLFIEKDPIFYKRIKHMTIEEFVADMMNLRERLDPFQLLQAEYCEAETSIKRKESILWKELLGSLSFTMNYPAKHFSAEDMGRLKLVLAPLISIVIAYIPQSSCEELLALHRAGLLDLIAVGDDVCVEPIPEGGVMYNYTLENETKAIYYKTFIDCVGQKHFSYNQFPFKSLLSNKKIIPARIKFQSPEQGLMAMNANKDTVDLDQDGSFYLHVDGIAINDNFQIIDSFGAYNKCIYIMATPYIGGYNPDYSGLDFCEKASSIISNSIFNTNKI